MEVFTPSTATPSAKSEVKGTVDAQALVVRMPDCEQYGGLRRWMDRAEVDEMVVREETYRGRKKRVQTVQFTAPPSEAPLRDGMEVYFIGHANARGFLGTARINEYALKEWIEARAASHPVHLTKIKLVTCNAGMPAREHEIGEDLTFVARLATLLQGVATGKVVGFSGYLLSALDRKAVYQVEPGIADLSGGDLAKREAEVREFVAGRFAHLIMPKGVLSNDWLAWAGEVICNDKGVALAKMLPKIGKSEATLAQALAGDKCGVCWPQHTKQKRADLEVMIQGMSSLNDKSSSSCKLQAKTEFAECLQEFRRRALKEWTWRKEQIAKAYQDEKKIEEFELKRPGEKMSNRQESPIPKS